MTEDGVIRYFMNLGIEPNEILGWLFSTPGIHNINGLIWYDNGVAKLPPNQPH